MARRVKMRAEVQGGAQRAQADAVARLAARAGGAGVGGVAGPDADALGDQRRDVDEANHAARPAFAVVNSFRRASAPCQRWRRGCRTAASSRIHAAARPPAASASRRPPSRVRRRRRR